MSQFSPSALGTWGLDTDYQDFEKVSLPIEPSHWPPWCINASFRKSLNIFQVIPITNYQGQLCIIVSKLFSYQTPALKHQLQPLII